MNNESGIFLPYVLFISAILFIVLFAAIQNYQKEIMITYQNIDQLRVETLFQKGYEKFKQENLLDSLGEKITVHYSFPDGNVLIEYLKLTEDEGQLHFEITTKSNSFVTMIKPVNLTFSQ